MNTLSRLALCTVALVSTIPLAHAQENTLTGNLGVYSQYRFRGIDQTFGAPAVQGGLDYTHHSGLYAGTWVSNVSRNSYNNGAGLEWDVYGGMKFAAADGVVWDVGALAYIYPGVRMNRAPGVPSSQGTNNVDVYLGLSVGAFSGKWSVATTDYFGLNAQSAGFAYANALVPNGGSAGSHYLDLNYNLNLGHNLNLGLHVGHTTVRHYGALSYSDAKISLSKEMQGLQWTAAVVATNADKTYYQVFNPSGQESKRVGRAGLVLSVSKTF